MKYTAEQVRAAAMEYNPFTEPHFMLLAFAAQLEAPAVPDWWRDVLESTLAALDFYANGEHNVTLYGRIDWVAERKRLADSGYVQTGESYSGDEYYSERGAKAESAANTLRAMLAATQPAAPAQWAKPPYDNCQFQYCDLPGQCRGEGKCHHPVTVKPAAPAQEAPGLDERALFEAELVGGGWIKEGYKIKRNDDGDYLSDIFDSAWWAWQARATLQVKANAGTLTPAPGELKLLEDGKTYIPADWTWCRIEFEPGYPEDVAFGPPHLMNRLKKWLDKHFAALSQRPDSDDNAPWLTLAHTICADAGIPPGHITARLEALRDLIEQRPDDTELLRDAHKVIKKYIEAGVGSATDFAKQGEADRDAIELDAAIAARLGE